MKKNNPMYILAFVLALLIVVGYLLYNAYIDNFYYGPPIAKAKSWTLKDRDEFVKYLKPGNNNLHPANSHEYYVAATKMHEERKAFMKKVYEFMDSQRENPNDKFEWTNELRTKCIETLAYVKPKSPTLKEIQNYLNKKGHFEKYKIEKGVYNEDFELRVTLTDDSSFATGLIPTDGTWEYYYYQFYRGKVEGGITTRGVYILVNKENGDMEYGLGPTW